TPTGFQKITDELLHTLIPLLSLVYWILFVNKRTLNWKNSFAWLGYPVIYSLFICIRGAFSGFYPYPFINVTELGYPVTLRNGVWLLVFFWVLSLLLIGSAKLFRQNKHLTQS
ncbi:MAG: Pr6Pr family membrane protein, partial [Bacteroidota bacterium]|nr:Pr6Pr family membrane protein [Bacteroidota bacterium]